MLPKFTHYMKSDDNRRMYSDRMPAMCGAWASRMFITTPESQYVSRFTPPTCPKCAALALIASVNEVQS